MNIKWVSKWCFWVILDAVVGFCAVIWATLSISPYWASSCPEDACKGCLIAAQRMFLFVCCSGGYQPDVNSVSDYYRHT
jgi:hypothetical protein